MAEDKTKEITPVHSLAVIYRRTDGGMCVRSGFKGRARRDEESDYDYVLREGRRLVPVGRPFSVIPLDDIPIDESYRDAWVCNLGEPDGVGECPSPDVANDFHGHPKTHIPPWDLKSGVSHSGGREFVEVHMGRAREWHREMMRQRRSRLWPAIDADRMRALDDGDATAQQQTAAKARALRDVTKHPDIDKAKTPDELKAVWPDCLK